MVDEKKKPIIALCYDFDKTLTPINMQEQGFLQKVCGYKDCDIAEFWKEVENIITTQETDSVSAFMYNMVVKAKAKGKLLRKEKLRKLGKDITFLKGVENWFDNINNFAKNCGCITEHYIISSGNKEIIEGTSIAKYFKRIYASCYHYDENGNADWPSVMVNYTNKTQFLFRIEKGTLDINDDRVNDYVSENDIRVPFENMIYIGDSDTDIPCMRIIKQSGGNSICVYESNEEGKREKADKMLLEGRVNYCALRDYSSGSELEKIVQNIIKSVVK